MWASIEEIINNMGPMGMSDDETDEEASRPNRKVLRRCGLKWRAQELSDFFTTIEEYILHRRAITTQGSPPLDRLPYLPTAVKIPKDRNPVKGLPLNYYNPTWKRLLHPVRIEELGATPPQALPDISK